MGAVDIVVSTQVVDGHGVRRKSASGRRHQGGQQEGCSNRAIYTQNVAAAFTHTHNMELPLMQMTGNWGLLLGGSPAAHLVSVQFLADILAPINDNVPRKENDTS